MVCILLRLIVLVLWVLKASKIVHLPDERSLIKSELKVGLHDLLVVELAAESAWRITFERRSHCKFGSSQFVEESHDRKIDASRETFTSCSGTQQISLRRGSWQTSNFSKDLYFLLIKLYALDLRTMCAGLRTLVRLPMRYSKMSSNVWQTSSMSLIIYIYSLN